MQISIIKIGKGKGIRLPKTILEKYGITDKAELIFQEDCLIIKLIKKVRDGWDTAFKAMAENGDDQLFIEDVFEEESFDI